MIVTALLIAGFLIAQDGTPASDGPRADTAPRLPFLENPSVTYGDCVASVSRGQASPRIGIIGRGPCRQPRSILLRAVRYHVAMSSSDLSDNEAEARRISTRIDETARSILEDYEADLQSWLDARSATTGNQHASD